MPQRESIVPIARIVAAVLMGAGALIMVGAVFADQIGLGGGGKGFGWKQMIAAISGLVILLIGLAWLLRPPTGAEYEDSEE